MGFMRAIPLICILSFSFILWCGFLSELHAQILLTKDPLTQAQIENQRAQATYYKRQADKRGFWKSLREYGGPIGAGVAAVVAIISFSLNYRATLRSRADGRFYEALNLFADRGNPGARSSAAGLLGQMASTRKRYYQTAFDQLSIALLAEREDEARNAIRAAFGRLAELDPGTAFAKLEAINRTLRDALADSFCRFCVARGAKIIEQAPATVWEEAEDLTSYDRPALAGLLQMLSKDNLQAVLTAAIRTHKTTEKPENEDCKARTRAELGEAAERLRSNIKSISEVLFFLEGKGGQNSVRSHVPKSLSFAFLIGGKFRDLQDCKVSRSILREADFSSANLTRAAFHNADLSSANFENAKLCQLTFSGAKLVGAVFKEADLTGTKFENSDLTGADLTGAKFRNTAIAPAAFQNTEWWKGDFRNQRDLLRAIHAKYKKDLPNLESLYVQGAIHRSVLDFIGKITEERL